jgi:DNA-binding transcriptional MerR regulator
MRVGELARRTGVSVRLLRYYVEQGLLHPVRRPGGFREYQESDVGVVRSIRRLLGAGLPTALIARMLPLLDADDRGADPGLAEVLTRECSRIDRSIADLHDSRQLLHRLIATAPPAPHR